MNDRKIEENHLQSCGITGISPSTIRSYDEKINENVMVIYEIMCVDSTYQFGRHPLKSHIRMVTGVNTDQ